MIPLGSVDDNPTSSDNWADEGEWTTLSVDTSASSSDDTHRWRGTDVCVPVSVNSWRACVLPFGRSREAIGESTSCRSPGPPESEIVPAAETEGELSELDRCDDSEGDANLLRFLPPKCEVHPPESLCKYSNICFSIATLDTSKLSLGVRMLGRFSISWMLLKINENKGQRFSGWLDQKDKTVQRSFVKCSWPHPHKDDKDETIVRQIHSVAFYYVHPLPVLVSTPSIHALLR